ncbi:YjdF family protein [Clostridium cochlearium]|uniref:YjdF family protein n=1 Tax=Clostridium cochlearium TaxID=1494 RepID=UPI001570CA06|nr:YjdF family protein [Clostridium cochlearium]MBV1821781.1 YjdF family protein [Bacteroidales bacterium MSK.15.36]MCG4579665.1 YjdF family protein [Clostridium cochlearium]NSJ92637.1 YjdF family protein [Coprococcus sp. MSK.21.13]
MITSIKLTVLFNEPFWIGIFEVYENDGYKVCKVTFGSEPKDEDIYYFILKEFKNLKFSSIIANLNRKLVIKRKNPKRMQRKIRKETKNEGIGTNAQIALKKQYEENKLINKKINKDRKNEIKERKFQLKQIKKKKKRKGH